MRQSIKASLAVIASAIAVVALVLTIVRDRGSQPYAIDKGATSGWTVAAADPSDPWVVEAQPPAALAKSLVEQISDKTGLRIVSSRTPSLPLVLRGEYDDALQGVYGIDAILRTAKTALDGAVFEPVCLAHRVDSGGNHLFFVAFTSEDFYEMRQELTPAQPEHGGIGSYDPAALSPILNLGTTDGAVGRWWPLTFSRMTDCQAPLEVR